MISYRTLLFGTIAVVAAAAPAAPAVADSLPALPLAVVRSPQDSLPALPLLRRAPFQTLETLVQFEHFVLRIAL